MLWVGFSFKLHSRIYFLFLLGVQVWGRQFCVSMLCILCHHTWLIVCHTHWYRWRKHSTHNKHQQPVDILDWLEMHKDRHMGIKRWCWDAVFVCPSVSMPGTVTSEPLHMQHTSMTLLEHRCGLGALTEPTCLGCGKQKHNTLSSNQKQNSPHTKIVWKEFQVGKWSECKREE